MVESLKLMNRDLSLDEFEKILADELSKFSVKFAVVYGSIVSGKQTDVSDIDLAVYCDNEEEYVRLAGLLTEKFVGVRLDVVNLKSLSSTDCYGILSKGRVVFLSSRGLAPSERGDDFYKRIKFKVMREYLDFEGTRRRIMIDMVQRIENGKYGRPAAEIKGT